MKAKRFLALALCAVMTVALLAGCGDKDGKDDKDGDKGKKSSPETVAEQTAKAILTFDLEKVFDLVPDQIVDDLVKARGFDSREDYLEEYGEGYYADVKEDYEDFFGAYTVKTEVLDTTDWNKDEVDEYNEELDSEGYDLEAKAGADVRVKITIDGEDEKQTVKTTVPVVQIGGKWYTDVIGSAYDNFLDDLLYLV